MTSSQYIFLGVRPCPLYGCAHTKTKRHLTLKGQPTQNSGAMINDASAQKRQTFPGRVIVYLRQTKCNLLWHALELAREVFAPGLEKRVTKSPCVFGKDQFAISLIFAICLTQWATICLPKSHFWRQKSGEKKAWIKKGGESSKHKLQC